MEDFPVAGKIQNSFFKSRVFPYCGTQRREVTVGPEYGVDVSIVNLGNGMGMAMTSDPLSLIPTLGLRESAWLSVKLMANDMATTGFAAQYAQFVLNLPVTLSAEEFGQYWKFIHEYCSQSGIAITGGHTGRFEGLQSTVSGGGTMITIAPYADMITSKGARPGNVLIMTKECALLSTAILSLSFPESIKKACGEEVHRQGCDLFYKTSAVEAGLAAGEAGRLTGAVTAMHDVTEGGVMGALYELAHASDCGLIVEEDKIPVGNAQQRICDYFQIDPRYCVGAGSMIIAAEAEKCESLIAHLERRDISASVIGKVVHREEGLIIKNQDERRDFGGAVADPYWNAFFSALNKGGK